MRVVAVEKHCLTPELRELLGPQIHPYYPWHEWDRETESRLTDIGEGRIAEMDAAGIDVQVLATAQPGLEHSPGADAIPVARAFNDAIAAAIASHPDRFAGFAALPTADPEASAEELSRAVNALGLCGAMVNGRTRERFLDDRFFWPIFEAAEALGVPICIHPMPPSRVIYDNYYSGFTNQLNNELAGGAWGWHIETGLHALRLVVAGVFDQFPSLQVILGHMGEGVLFMLGRADEKLIPQKTGLQRSLLEYVTQNFYVSTAGFFTNPPLRLALDTIGADRIMFADDHPFGSGAEGRRFLDQAPITEEQREKIAHGNADRLLKLGPS